MVFKKLFQGLKKTRDKLSTSLKSLFGRRKLDDEFIEDLEEILYSADLGTTASHVIERIQQAYRKKEIREVAEVQTYLSELLLERLEGCGGTLRRATQGTTVIMVCGVNGSGKTTSIAKLAHRLKNAGHSVVLGAADTFRAAAVEQLTIWAERIGIPIVTKPSGSDPAAVAHDAAETARDQRADFLILDTAGRLHTQKNLMQELEKIRRVLGKQIPDAPHEVLLVLDSTTGQNALVQAEKFSEAVEVTGLVLAKLDGTAKGGAVFGIRERLTIPVKFVGLGERIEDLDAFDPKEFVQAVLQHDLGAEAELAAEG
ncbi:MAG: signal recognition particle-docking protein FtsY [Planctomycetes bacterium]|nr:signal recognition particle-docking protein FtsY [Planctomycetota bacterium]MCB9891576.1 signal recognition particle-docking protein FtsY [Planctomycetota bacterium]